MGTTGSLTGPHFDIASEAGQLRGSNLFHSLSKLNLDASDVATFKAPASGAAVTDIVARVTGGASSINGTIASGITGANLYLLNPAGVVFGPNASLSVTGSFHVSTANYLKMADGSKFYTDAAKELTLTSAAPAAFGFLTSSPAAITVQGTLTLDKTKGKTFSIVGGDIQVDGGGVSRGLLALSSLLKLVSVASAGEVSLADDPSVASFPRLGTITVSNKALLDVTDFNNQGAGTVRILGGKLVVGGGSTISADNGGPTQAAPLGIDFRITGAVLVQDDQTSVRSSVQSGSGRPGDVSIKAGTLNIGNNASVSNSSINANATGGDLRIETGSLTITGGGSILSSPTGGRGGRPGSVTITVEGPIVITGSSATNLSRIQSTSLSATQDAGAISILARSLELSAGGSILAETRAKGRGGDVSLSVGDLTLSSGGTIATSSRPTFAAQFGPAGTTTITATGTVSLAGAKSGISSNTQGSGAGGDVRVQALQVRLAEQATISATSSGAGNAGVISVTAGDAVTLSGGAQITTSSQPSKAGPAGAAGSIAVTATNLVSLSGSNTGFFSTTTGSGAGGSVTARTDQVRVTDGAVISAKASGSGQAGSIDITGSDVTLTGGAQVTTSSTAASASAGAAGNISVRAEDSISLSGGSTGFFSTTAGGGGGGSIALQADRILLSSGAAVSAKTSGSGNAGSIGLIAGDDVVLSGGAQITTSSQPSGAGTAGAAGSINVIATDVLALSGQDTSVLSTTTGSGTGGNIALHANSIQLSQGAAASARSSGRGNAGGISIIATQLFESFNGRVTTEASQADGGNITLVAGSLVHLRDSQITATVHGGAGNGGNITIDPTFVVLKNSSIVADAFGGRGGNITIIAGTFLADPGSIVSASSALGINGTVSIQSLPTNLAQTLTLASQLMPTARLLRERCAARALEGGYSNLVVAGRAGVPVEPGIPLLNSPPLDGTLPALPSSLDSPRQSAEAWPPSAVNPGYVKEDARCEQER